MAGKPKSRRTATRLAGAVFAVLLIVGFVWFVRTMMAAKTGKPTRQVQVIQVIRPPPPPPDQPPPPPPEKTQEALPKDKPEPEPEDNQPPPDQPLGIDADATAGSDSFGLQARAGGSDLVGGTGSAPFARYTNQIADAIRERLSSLACAKSARGSLSMHVTLDAEGKFKQVQLATTTGNDKVDQCIASGLSSVPAISDKPPPGMPEQITIRVIAR